MIRRDHFLHWFGLQAVVRPGKGNVFIKCHYIVLFTDNASHKAWDGDPKSFPEVDSIVEAVWLDSDKERDDGEVDEEDDAESDQ